MFAGGGSIRVERAGSFANPAEPHTPKALPEILVPVADAIDDGMGTCDDMILSTHCNANSPFSCCNPGEVHGEEEWGTQVGDREDIGE